MGNLGQALVFLRGGMRKSLLCMVARVIGMLGNRRQKLEEQGGEQHLVDQLGLRWEESKAC